MSNKRTDVVGIGAVSWDRFLVVPWFPIPRDKIRAIRTEESAGGAVSTALVALRRWGLNCRYVGVLGYDEASDRIVEDLVREEILLDGLVRRSDAEAKCNTIIVDNRTGGRCVIHSPHRVSPLETREIRPELFAGARVLHLDTSEEECALDAAKMAKNAGLTVTLDANSVTPKVRDLLRAVDYVIAPRSFAEEFTHQDNPSRAAYALHLLAEKPVVITDGANGSYFQSADRAFHQPAHGVPVVDCTGAGDVFHAAFIYGLLAAWDMQRILRFASWAGASACREIGARKGIPVYESVHQFMRNDHG